MLKRQCIWNIWINCMYKTSNDTGKKLVLTFWVDKQSPCMDVYVCLCVRGCTVALANFLRRSWCEFFFSMQAYKTLCMYKIHTHTAKGIESMYLCSKCAMRSQTCVFFYFVDFDSSYFMLLVGALFFPLTCPSNWAVFYTYVRCTYVHVRLSE